MKIEHAPNILYYEDPRRWIVSNALPVKRTCGKCETELTFEMESDLYAKQIQNEWYLGFTCIVCGSKRILDPITSKQQKEEKAKKNSEYLAMSDDEYQELRNKQIVERTTKRQEYLSVRSPSWLPARQDYHKAAITRHNLEWEDYIEEKFLPEVLPEERPKMDRLIANYSEALEYYVKQAKEAKAESKVIHAVAKEASTEGFTIVTLARLVSGILGAVCLVYGIVEVAHNDAMGFIAIVVGAIALSIALSSSVGS